MKRVWNDIIKRLGSKQEVTIWRDMVYSLALCVITCGLVLLIMSSPSSTIPSVYVGIGILFIGVIILLISGLTIKKKDKK
jgi:protein-S-isoprenylcysteine O-methyltransferase Ste14